MHNPDISFNILTFDFPSKKQSFYFSDQETEQNWKIHKSNFPNKIESIFPEIKNNNIDYLYTSYLSQKDNFKSLLIDLKTENPGFTICFYNNQIHQYFKNNIKQIIKPGNSNNQIWILSKNKSTSKFNVYSKFSIKVKLCTTTKFPELLISFDGRSEILKQSIAKVTQNTSPTKFDQVLIKNNLLRWSEITLDEFQDFSKYFPVLNKKLIRSLNISSELPQQNNSITNYQKEINTFYDTFLNTKSFKKLIPIHKEGYLNLNSVRIKPKIAINNLLKNSGEIYKCYNQNSPKYIKPYKSCPHKTIHLFFIYHKDDKNTVIKLNNYFVNGLDWFKGLYHYAKILFYYEKEFNITFENRDNPIPKIENKLSNRIIDPNIKYFAIYITPQVVNKQDFTKQIIFYNIKTLLLNRNITSHAVDPKKIHIHSKKCVNNLPNIAIVILAKLEGIPWRLNTPIKNELIVGIGSYKHKEEDIEYIACTYSFSNDGKFNSFEYFIKEEFKILIGKISQSITDYESVHGYPDRLILHFCKSMTEKELKYFEKALIELNLDIPVFNISINKTETQEILAFDKNSKKFLLSNGSYINVDNNKYLLFINNQNSINKFNIVNSCQFPIMLNINCTDKSQLKNKKVITDLIDQVFQYSHMYWKSFKQQNIPVTIKYPEMIARIAPYLDGKIIPDFGKDNLWFL